MMRVDASTVITDEKEFLRVNKLRAKGDPMSAVTKAAKYHLEEYYTLKQKQLCAEK